MKCNSGQFLYGVEEGRGTLAYPDNSRLKILGKQLCMFRSNLFRFCNYSPHSLPSLFQGICFQVFWDLAARSTCWSWSVHTFPWEMPSGVLPSTNQDHIITLHLHCVNPSSVSLQCLLFKDFGSIYLQVIIWMVLNTEWTD